jgi:adenylate cyclase
MPACDFAPALDRIIANSRTKESSVTALPSTRFGTERYPEKVALRLKAVSITAWLSAAITAFFAVMHLLDPIPGMWRIAAVNGIATLVFALVPLLHRFGPLFAPLALVVVSYLFILWVIFVFGTGGGTYLYCLTATAIGILLLGTERKFLTAALGVISVGMIVGVHLLFPYDTGFVLPATQSFYFVINVVASSAMLFVIVFYAVSQIARAEAAAEREYDRSESLLSNILPRRVAGRLEQRTDAVIADSYPEASILFVDMAGFTARASEMTPEELVQFLNGVFTKLDSLVERHGLEKIKTTGDAYMVVSGVPDARLDHAAALADLALDMREALAALVDPRGRTVAVRIGIASGAVVAGVVGTRKFFYDVWGDPVNVASRMESTGEPGKIQVAAQTRDQLTERFDLEERGVIDVKGKGFMRTWFLVGRKHIASDSWHADTPKD